LIELRVWHRACPAVSRSRYCQSGAGQETGSWGWVAAGSIPEWPLL